MKLELTENEIAAFRRIEARLEMDLDGVDSRRGATIVLLEEELQLVREILAGGGAIDEPVEAPPDSGGSVG